MANQICSNPNEPALRFFAPKEVSAIPPTFWTQDPTDHGARNWLLGKFPRVISRSLCEIKDPDFQAPDGSLFRLLTYGKDGQIAQAIFPSTMVANAVIHPRITEQWYCCRGKGILWLKNAETSAIKKIIITASSCLTIPQKTAFRFINTEKEPLEFVIATTPLWTNLQDGEPGESLLPLDELSQLESHVLAQEAPKNLEDKKPFSLGGRISILEPTEATECVQMSVWDLSPDTTTKVFRSTSGTQSYFVVSGKGECKYSVPDPRAEGTVVLKEGCALTCPSSAARQIQTHSDPLTLLVVSQPKLQEFEETSF